MVDFKGDEGEDDEEDDDDYGDDIVLFYFGGFGFEFWDGIILV